MPSPSDVADALIAWAQSVIPELASTFDYPKEEDPGAMPELAVDFRNIRSVDAGTAHRPRKQYEAILSIVVETMPYQDSAHSVWSMADRMIEAQRADRTLGFGTAHDVPMQAGPLSCALPGVITWPDGTDARGLTVSVQLTLIEP